MPDVNTIWFTAYTAGGFKVSFTLDANPADLPTAEFIDSTMARLGYHAQPVELADNTSIEDIDAVVRAVTSKGDPIIYCYKQALEWKVGQVYLNNAAEIAAFEAASGLKLDSLPLYEGQGAPQRKDRNPTKWERACRVFQITKTLVGQDEQGKPRYKYSLHGRSAAPSAPSDEPAPPRKQTTPTEAEILSLPASALEGDKAAQQYVAAYMAANNIKPVDAAVSLKVKRLSEYPGTIQDMLFIINPPF